MSRFTSAEVLVDFGDLGHAAGEAARRCNRSGLDPAGYRGLIGAAMTLSGGPARVGSVRAFLDASGVDPWRDDKELLQTVAELEVELMSTLDKVQKAITLAAESWAEGRRLVTSTDKSMQARGRLIMTDCEATLELLRPAAGVLGHALGRTQAVPEELGETYATAYRLIARGHVLPHDGRWITGADIAQPNGEPHADNPQV